MWYRQSLAQVLFRDSDNLAKNKPVDTTSDREYDAKIVEAAAERSVRRLLYLKGNYSPEDPEVKKLVARILTKLREQYGTLNAIRRTISGENLSPVVDAVAETIIK